MRLRNIFTGAALLALGQPSLAAPAAAADYSSPKGRKPPQFHNSARHAGADPHVIWDAASNQYYAYSTEGADEGYHFAVYSSPDLSTWHKASGGVLRACYDDEMNALEGGQACWAKDWYWAPETYHNEETGWYFFFFAGRLRDDLAKDYFRYSAFEEPSKIGVAVSRSPTGPFEEIESRPFDYYPFDPDYHDVNLVMDEAQMLPPPTREAGRAAPRGTYIPTIDVNIFFDRDDRVYLYLSRNAYRNWIWDDDLGKYIEESNIIVVEMERGWWDDPDAKTMPEIVEAQRDVHARDAPPLPCNITAYNGTGEIGRPPRKDGWQTVISYGADKQDWENYHVHDYAEFNGTKKDRRWSEGSTVIVRPASSSSSSGGGGGGNDDQKHVYLMTYSANNFEASNYGVGFATAPSPFGPFTKSASNPVLAQDPDAGTPIYSTGHGSIVASPPKKPKAHVGAQDVTLFTPAGAELFYVHHARNATTLARSMYTTRMTLDEENMAVGADDVLSMHLTSADQPLPKWTYPIRLDAKCAKGQKGQFQVRVLSKPGASFDLAEGSNRVVALPGERPATYIEADDSQEGSFLVTFGEGDVKELAYQRLSADGSWVTEAKKHAKCKKGLQEGQRLEM